MIQLWERLTFLHWPFDPVVVQRLLPAGLQLETYGGAAWVGLVPFYLRIRPPRAPWIPWAGQFCETNVRTYVTDGEGRSGVWFFSLDVERLGTVVSARTAYGLPYLWSNMHIKEDGDRIEYAGVRRVPRRPRPGSRVVVRRGARIQPEFLTLFDHFLTARWNVFHVSGNRYGFTRASHPPWPLHSAELLELDDALVGAAGLPQPQADPVVHYSPGVEARIGIPRRAAPLTTA